MKDKTIPRIVRVWLSFRCTYRSGVSFSASFVQLKCSLTPPCFDRAALRARGSVCDPRIAQSVCPKLSHLWLCFSPSTDREDKLHRPNLYLWLCDSIRLLASSIWQLINQHHLVDSCTTIKSLKEAAPSSYLSRFFNFDPVDSTYHDELHSAIWREQFWCQDKSGCRWMESLGSRRFCPGEGGTCSSSRRRKQADIQAQHFWCHHGENSSIRV